MDRIATPQTTSDSRPSLILIGFNAQGSGLTRVTHEAATALSMDFDVDYVAIGNRKAARTSSWQFHPALENGGDHSGLQSCLELIHTKRPSLILIIHDAWKVNFYLPWLQRCAPEIPVMAYCPLDGKICLPELVKPLSHLSRLVLYTHFAQQEVEQAAQLTGTSLPPIRLLPHGIDRRTFFPLPEADRMARRKSLFPYLENPESSFLVLNANCFQQRKRIDLSIRGFALFARNKPSNVKLVLHHTRLGHSKRKELARMISETERETGPHSVPLQERILISPDPGLDWIADEDLNGLFNACQVGINTSGGEGWGLVAFEHAATGAAQVLPDHSACAELWKDHAVLLPASKPYLTAPGFPLEFAEIDPVDLAQTLDQLYNDNASLEFHSKNCLAHARSDKWKWKTIGNDWRQLAAECLNPSIEFAPIPESIYP